MVEAAVADTADSTHINYMFSRLSFGFKNAEMRQKINQLYRLFLEGIHLGEFLDDQDY